MSLVFSILNSLGLVGLAIFLYFLIEGLTTRITNLTLLATEQKKTLETVRERAEEFDKLSKAYKQALEDFQQMGEKLEARRAILIRELEEANEKKDKEIIRLKQLELEELEIKKKNLDELPETQERIRRLLETLNRQIKIVSPMQSSLVKTLYPQLWNYPIGADVWFAPRQGRPVKVKSMGEVTQKQLEEKAPKSDSADAKPEAAGESGANKGDDGLGSSEKQPPEDEAKKVD